MSQSKEERRRQPYALLGDLPHRSREISLSKVEEEEWESYGSEKLVDHFETVAMRAEVLSFLEQWL